MCRNYWQAQLKTNCYFGIIYKHDQKKIISISNFTDIVTLSNRMNRMCMVSLIKTTPLLLTPDECKEKGGGFNQTGVWCHEFVNKTTLHIVNSKGTASRDKDIRSVMPAFESKIQCYHISVII